jgi:hypothetical protein
MIDLLQGQEDTGPQCREVQSLNTELGSNQYH